MLWIKFCSVLFFTVCLSVSQQFFSHFTRIPVLHNNICPSNLFQTDERAERVRCADVPFISQPFFLRNSFVPEPSTFQQTPNRPKVGFTLEPGGFRPRTDFLCGLVGKHWCLRNQVSHSFVLPNSIVFPSNFPRVGSAAAEVALL